MSCFVQVCIAILALQCIVGLSMANPFEGPADCSFRSVIESTNDCFEDVGFNPKGREITGSTIKESISSYCKAINGPAEECALGATKFCGNYYSIYLAFEKRKEFCAAANKWIQPCNGFSMNKTDTTNYSFGQSNVSRRLDEVLITKECLRSVLRSDNNCQTMLMDALSTRDISVEEFNSTYIFVSGVFRSYIECTLSPEFSEEITSSEVCPGTEPKAYTLLLIVGGHMSIGADIGTQLIQNVTKSVPNPDLFVDMVNWN